MTEIGRVSRRELESDGARLAETEQRTGWFSQVPERGTERRTAWRSSLHLY